jgi:hypothetical protein
MLVCPATVTDITPVAAPAGMTIPTVATVKLVTGAAIVPPSCLANIIWGGAFELVVKFAPSMLTTEPIVAEVGLKTLMAGAEDDIGEGFPPPQLSRGNTNMRPTIARLLRPKRLMSCPKSGKIHGRKLQDWGPLLRVWHILFEVPCLSSKKRRVFCIQLLLAMSLNYLDSGPPRDSSA